MTELFLGNTYKKNNDSSQTTLWMGDLDPWMNEEFIRYVWSLYGQAVVVKIIRHRITNVSAGYAFVQFSDSQSAQRALHTLHGLQIPESHRTFKLNWASGGGICDRKEDRTPEYSLFVGDLSSDVDETFLLSIFRSRYLSCHSAKIMSDSGTGLSRGYGFVRFLSLMEQLDALTEMNGIICNGRPIRVALATPKSHNSKKDYNELALRAPALVQQPTDPNNTTVFVGGLSSPVSEEQLGSYFAPYGEVSYVKIPPGKGCGFVQYVTRQSAELAIEKMNGFVIGSSGIRLSWGRSHADKVVVPTSPVSFLFDNHPIMSPTTTITTTTSSTIHHNNNTPTNLLGSFKPLSPPHHYHHNHHQDNLLFKPEDNLLFKPEDDWLNTSNLKDEDVQNDWHMNGIYA